MEPDLELRMVEGGMRVGLFCFACPADFSPYVISSFLTQDKRGGCLDPPLRPVFIRKKYKRGLQCETSWLKFFLLYKSFKLVIIMVRDIN